MDLGIFADKLTQSSLRIIRQACEDAKALDRDELMPEHALVAFAKLEQRAFEEFLVELDLNPQVVVEALEARSTRGDHPTVGLKASQAFRELLINSLKHAHERNRRHIEPADLFVGAFRDSRSFPVKLFKQLGVDQETVRQRIDTHTSDGRARSNISKRVFKWFIRAR